MKGSTIVCMAALVLSPAMSNRAQAFGGLWSSQGAPVEQAAEKIIFVDNADATITAIVQIEYAGPPQKFAWVIPVPGMPTIGISSSTVFRRLDAATTPQYWLEVAATGTCTQGDTPQAALGARYEVGGAQSDAGTPAPVDVIDQGSVGQYEYVDIAVDPALGDPVAAATDWLTGHGYDLSGLDGKALGPYLREGLNLLAFKLQSGADAGAIRPVILSYESKRPSIPIRAAAVAAQAHMAMKVWVIGPAQAVPVNYQAVALDDGLLDWLSVPRYAAGTLPAGGAGVAGAYVSTPSNYDAVVGAAVHAAHGHGFVTELGAPASQFRDKVWSAADEQQLAMLSGQSFESGIDAILAARNRYGDWDGFLEAVAGAATLPPDVTVDELSRDPERYRGAVEVDTEIFLRLLQEKVVKPVADTAALLYGGPYLTRLYTSMSAQDMTVDPAFDYNFDLAQVGNVHIAKQLVKCSSTQSQDEAPWRIELPEGGVVTGKGNGAWPATKAAKPGSATPALRNQCSVSDLGSASSGCPLALLLPGAGVALAMRRRRSRR
jgi:hypothetical protein